MIEEVLVGVDGSSYSKATVEFSIFFSKLFAAKITFIHVVDTIQVSEVSKACESLSFDPFLSFNKELKEVCELEMSALYKKGELLLKETKQFAQTKGVSSKSILETGIIPRILDEVSCGYDMLFVGRKGINDEFIKDSLGINIDSLLRRIKIPIFVSPGVYYDIKHIIVAFDGKKASLKGIEVAKLIHNKSEGINIKALYVDQDNSSITNSLNSIDFMEKVVLKRNQNLAQTIINYVEDIENPLLIIGKSNKGEIMTEILGSVTESILRKFPKFAILVVM